MMTATTFAQQPQGGAKPQRPTAEQRADYKTERMTKQLSLTDAQAKEVHALNLASEKELDAQMEKMKAARAEKNAKMKAILTPEQYQQWKESEKNPRMQGKGHPGGDRPGGQHHGKPGQGPRPDAKNHRR